MTRRDRAAADVEFLSGRFILYRRISVNHDAGQRWVNAAD